MQYSSKTIKLHKNYNNPNNCLKYLMYTQNYCFNKIIVLGAWPNGNFIYELYCAQYWLHHPSFDHYQNTIFHFFLEQNVLKPFLRLYSTKNVLSIHVVISNYCKYISYCMHDWDVDRFLTILHKRYMNHKKINKCMETWETTECLTAEKDTFFLQNLGPTHSKT